MTTIVDIDPNDNWAVSLVAIEANFDNLNIDKLEDAPVDGQQYARKDADWDVVTQAITKSVTFVVTTAFASWEVIDITDWTWGISWVSTRTIWDTWDIISIWSSASVFNADASLSVIDNKTLALKATEVIFDSATSFHFTRALSIWEWFIINDGSTSGWGALGNTTINWTLDVTWLSTLANTQINWTLWATWGVTLSSTLSVAWDVALPTVFIDDSISWSTVNLVTAVWIINTRLTYVRTDWSTNITIFVPSWSETINWSGSFPISGKQSIELVSDWINWLIDSDIVWLKNKRVRVEDDFDFPLINWINYLIEGAIILTQPLVFPSWANIWLEGTNLNSNTITYTGTWALLQGTTVWRVFIKWEIQFFGLWTEPFVDLTWVWGLAGNFTIRTCVVIWFSTKWSIVDVFSVVIRNSNFVNCQWPLIIDNINFGSMAPNFIANLSADSALPHIELRTKVAAFNIADSAVQPQPNEFVIKIDSGIDTDSRIVIDTVAYRSTILGWGFFDPSGLDESSPLVESSANWDQKDSQNAGQMNIPTSVTVAVVEDDPTIVNDATTGWTNIWSSILTDRFTFNASTWRLTYIWVRPTDAIIIATASIEKVGWWADTLAGYIALNGSIDVTSVASTQNANPTSITCISAQQIDTWDFFEFFVENQDSGADVIVNVAQFIIKA